MRRTPNFAPIQPWDVKDFLRPDRGGDILEKRAHLIDLRREHLMDQVFIQEILPPEK
jgi:hypothetical protein